MVTMTLPACVTTSTAAKTLVRSAAAEHGLPGPIVDDAELIAGVLVRTEGGRPGSTVRLEVECRPSGIAVRVIASHAEDSHIALRAGARHDPFTTELLRDLAHSYGYATDGYGTAIWAELIVAPSP
jgi:hypothetical protein